MTDAAPGILARIVQHKRGELAQLAGARDAWERQAADNLPLRRDFALALRSKTPAIIAEIKRASPSKGLLAEDFDPPAIARDYESGGAAALSVLTDLEFFQGKLSDLCAARKATKLPVLRKDFILEEVQVAEAAAHNADAILLIAVLLPVNRLRQLREYAAAFRMASLVEVHDERELEIALASGAQMIGVNNRDLRTFQVALETSLRLAGRIPPGILKVSESGISTSEEVHKLRAAGFDALLVGEHLVRAADRAQALRSLAT